MHPVDLAVLVLYLSGAVALGLLLGRRSVGVEGYLLAGRQLPWWAVLGSIVATETSTATVLSLPGKTFVPGGDFRQYVQLALGLIAGRTIIIWLLLPGFFRGRFFTAYELLRRRFGRATQRTASLLFLVTRNVGDGLRLYLAALALSHFLEVSLGVCVLLVGGVTLFYTYWGGMKSVVWNDCVQLVIYLLGAALALGWIAAQLPSGWDSLWEFGHRQGKFRMFDFSWDGTDPGVFWVGLLGGAFLTLGTHGTDQMMVQRLLSTSTQRGAAAALFLSGVAVLGQFVLFLLLGVGVAAFYQYHVPELLALKGDEAVSRFISHHLPQGWGLVGLLLAAVFAASMSTLSSSLNSSATAVVNDFLRPGAARNWSQTRLLRTSRGLTLAFGLLQMLIAYLGASASQAVVDNVLTIAALNAGAMLGLFLLGTLFRHVGQVAALAGMLLGLGSAVGLYFFWPLPFPLYAPAGALVTVATGLAVALVVPPPGSPPSVAPSSEDPQEP